MKRGQLKTQFSCSFKVCCAHAVGFSLVIFALTTWELAIAEISTSNFEIRSIKAYLHLQHHGTFSDDISNLPSGALWNTIIGAGWAKSPSNATMVIVEIVGQSRVFEPTRKVEMVVTEIGKTKKVILKKTSSIGGLSEDGKYLAAFWVYDTGCLPIQIVAQISGQAKVSRMEKRINFSCGE